MKTRPDIKTAVAAQCAPGWSAGASQRQETRPDSGVSLSERRRYALYHKGSTEHLSGVETAIKREAGGPTVQRGPTADIREETDNRRRGGGSYSRKDRLVSKRASETGHICLGSLQS